MPLSSPIAGCRSWVLGAAMLVLEDVDESRGSLDMRVEASEPPAVVLRLRGIWETSESSRRRVGADLSLAALKPKSEVLASFSDEKRLEEELNEERGTFVSGVEEL